MCGTVAADGYIHLVAGDKLGIQYQQRIFINEIGFYQFAVQLQECRLSEMSSLHIILSVSDLLNAVQLSCLNAQAHRRSLERIGSVIHILLSVENIVLQHFQVYLVVSGISPRLVVAEDIAFMNAYLVHDLGSNLVGGKILVLLLQPHIVPDHILGLEQILVFHILYRQVHGGQMIAVHDQDHIFVQLGQGIGQFLDKLIHFIDLIAVIFPFVVHRIGAAAGYSDLGILDHGLLRIIPMSLYGNGVHVIRAFGIFHRLKNVLGQIPVPDPAVRIGVILSGHIFRGGKAVKAQIGKHTFPAVEIGFIVVNGVGSVSQLFQHIGGAFTGGLL